MESKLRKFILFLGSEVQQIDLFGRIPLVTRPLKMTRSQRPKGSLAGFFRAMARVRNGIDVKKAHPFSGK